MYSCLNSLLKDEIWCDVTPMDVWHIILGRPRLYNLDVNLYGRTNSFSFVFKSKKIMLTPLKPKPIDMSKNKDVTKVKGLNIISPKVFERVVIQESIVFTLGAKKITMHASEEPPEEVK